MCKTRVFGVEMKRKRATTRVERVPPTLPVLPLEIVHDIFRFIPWDDVTTLWSVLQSMKSCYKVLLPTLRRMLANVGIISDAVFYLTIDLESERVVSVLGDQLREFLSKNQSRSVKMHVYLSEFELSHATASHLLAVLNLVALEKKHLYRKDPGSGIETVFFDVAPTEQVRLRDVFYHQKNGTVVAPLSEACKIKIVRDMPDTNTEQVEASAEAIKGEPDANMKALLNSYLFAKKVTTRTERRAKCFLLTKRVRKLRHARPGDCFNDVVVKLKGTYVHIYSDAASHIRGKCFNFAGKPEDLKLACGLWKNTDSNWKKALV